MEKCINNIEETQEIMYACWLHSIPGFGRTRCYQLLQSRKRPSAVYHMTKEEIAGLFGNSAAAQWQQYRQECMPDRLMAEYDRQNIRYTYCQARNFPQRLANIPDPPFGIYYKGNLPKDTERTVAIIGARKYSEYGRCMAQQFAAELARAGVSIISGMAMGIDGISQRAALKAGGQSFGVLGCGVDIIYPESNTDLYHALSSQGGVISEYTPATQPKAGLFPQRNRIISALADVILVVEARQKSGTLITVDMALEQGKEVYVIPGRCTDNLSLGCNRLLRQGAVAATSAQDILEDMGWDSPTQESGRTVAMPKLSEAAKDIVEVLTIMPCTQEDIVTELRKKGLTYSIPTICQGLLELELMQVAGRKEGFYQLFLPKL